MTENLVPMNARDDRRASNEALFREVNERIEELSSSLVDETVQEGSVEIVCECGAAGCTEPITTTLAEYETIRANATRFAVLPGHELPDIERVVERHSAYLVVEKLEEVSGIAVEHDPRS